jgi:hypothetical protein
MTGGIWEYSGATRPSPHGKVLASGLTASVSTTPGVPYPVPWTAWSTIDLRPQGISTDKPFVVSFGCVGDGSTNPRVMVNAVPEGQGSSLTYSTTSSSGANWYVYTANTAGDSVWSYLIRAYVRVEPLAPLSVYPGDANNDGLVDVRDVLPIGQYFGVVGPVRAGGSLTWQAQEIVDPWSPTAAAYADCDGSGTIAAADVQAILTNWGRSRVGMAPPAFDRVQMCEELIAAIDASGSSSEATRAIRAEIQQYMQTTLGVSFDYALDQNWPNPFNPSTTIRFSVPENVARASLTIVNILGQVVWQKELSSLAAGRHSIIWNGETLQGGTAASGVYLYKLNAGRYQSTKRMTLLK